MKIEMFIGSNRWLSNFHVADNGFCVEHHYQAAKATSDEDRKWILSAATPGEAKRRGRKIKVRPDWDDVKVKVMNDLLHIKFIDPDLRNKLIATGDAELIEGNTWGDTFWGVCNGVGQNMLGKLLMQHRARLHQPVEGYPSPKETP